MNSTSRQSKIASVMAVAFVAISMCTIVLVGGFGILYSYRMQQDEVADEQRIIALDAANEVEHFIHEKIRTLKDAALFGSPMTLQTEEQRIVLAKLLGEEPAFRQAFIYDRARHERTAVSRLSSEKRRVSVEDIEEIFSQLQKGETYVGSAYIDDDTSEPLMHIGVPCKDVFGDLTGALLVEVNLKFMWDLVGSIRVGEAGTTYVVDRQGQLIAAADIARVLKKESVAGVFEVNKFMHATQGETSEFEASKGMQGTDVVASYVALGTPDWAVVVEVPVSEALAPFFRMVRWSFVSMGLSLLLAVFAAHYISRRMTKPLMALRDAAKEISKGNLKMRIAVISDNEIGELASDFNAMAEQLGALHANLEGIVAARTRELQEKIADIEKMNSIMIGREVKMTELKQRIQELEKRVGQVS